MNLLLTSVGKYVATFIAALDVLLTTSQLLSSAP